MAQKLARKTMGKIPVPIPNIGQLLLGAEEQGRSNVLYYLVIGVDGALTVWKRVSPDGPGWWEAPIPFDEFENVRIDGLPLNQIIARRFASL
jgi:hypothetical protein